MALTDRLDSFQRRHPAAGYPIAVIYKYVDDQGGYLAALITYYGFLSLFPLLLLLSTVLGFVLAGNPQAQTDILNSALAQFPVIGGELGTPGSIGGGPVGLTIGIIGALYGGSGVALATQNAMNIAWAVPRNSRPNPLTARVRSLVLLGTVGVAVIATSVLSAVAGGAGGLGGGWRAGAVVLSVVVNTVALVLGFRIATARHLSVRDVLPGAFAAAVIWQLLQSFGATYVGRVVRDSSDTNAVFAVVLGLIAFIYLAAVAAVLCVEVNVVRVDRLYPRALLTPLTDDVDLTAGDERVYRGKATSERHKGFEEIDVTFDKQER